jgi:hypothetical protein
MANSNSRYLPSRNTQYDCEKVSTRHLLIAEQSNDAASTNLVGGRVEWSLSKTIVVLFAFGSHSIKVASSNQKRQQRQRIACSDPNFLSHAGLQQSH